MDVNWMENNSVGIIVCGCDGTVLYMNEKAVQRQESAGGRTLIGKNMFECHPKEVVNKVKSLINSDDINVYISKKQQDIELVYQFPWYSDGEQSGFVSLTLVLPPNIKNFLNETK